MKNFLLALTSTLLVMLVTPPTHKTVNEQPIRVKKQSIIQPLQPTVYAQKQEVAKVPVAPPKPAPVAPTSVTGTCSDWLAQAGISDPDAVWLIGKESGCEPGRLNKSSLACGIPQSLPCIKLYPYATKEWIVANKVERNGKWYLPTPEPVRELVWMKAYVANRYTTWANARAWHRSHNWY